MSSAAASLRGPFLTSAEVLQLPEPLDTLFLLSVGVLASTILLKFAAIQYLEYIYFLLIAVLATRLLRAQLSVRTDPPVARLALWWLLFFVLAVLTAIYSLNRTFYVFDKGLLHQPVWVSIARLGEVVANVAGMLYLGHVFRRHRHKLLFTMRAYLYTGVASAYYSLLCQFTFRILHHLLPNSSDRANGFYNEGGPYGLYMISVLSLALFLRPLERNRAVFYTNFLVCLMALALSASKAAYVAIILIFTLLALLAATMKQRLVSLGSLALIVTILISQTNLKAGLERYAQGQRGYEILSNLDPNNPNLTVGRTAGLYLAPKMIAMHPWFGVGFAHYGIVRNTPAYRGLSAFVSINDVPGLGMLQYLAELGFPITILLTFLLFAPFTLLRSTTHLRRATALGLIQPTVHFLGAQLNLTYPWVLSAFAIGLTSWTIRSEEQLDADTTAPILPALPAAIPLLSAADRSRSGLAG